MTLSRLLLSITILTLAVTGLMLFYLAPATEMDLPHAWNGMLRECHGYAAMLALMLFGYFIKDHVQRKWRQIKRYPDAVLHLLCWIGLIVTAAWIYYPLNHWSVPFTVADLHTGFGIALLVILPLHSARYWWR